MEKSLACGAIRRCLNGVCITQWPPTTNQIVTGGVACGSGGNEQSYATCPGGYVLSGGGYQLTSYNSSQNPQTAPDMSFPSSSNTWEINMGGTNIGACFKAYAVCVSH